MEGLLVTPIYFQIKVFLCPLGRSGEISRLLTFEGQKKKWRSEDRPGSFSKAYRLELIGENKDRRQGKNISERYEENREQNAVNT
jgi:hypothetical protein